MAVSKEYYKDFSVDEFIQDDFFIDSTQMPNEETETFWKEFLLQHPHQKETLMMAGQFIKSLKFQQAIPQQGAKDRIWNAVLSETKNGGAVVSMNSRRWYWAAASVILVLAAGAYFWSQSANNREPSLANNSRQTEEILPGKDGAILTLANGEQVVLDSLGNGVIATQNGAQVLLKDGHLAYDATGKSSGEIAFNTMSTPKGRQFNVKLPDGTQVWLNSASSIKYPTIFTGKERKVTISGEAYFEVAKNPSRPFRVLVAPPLDGGEGMEVEVLGTHFNINAYHDEASIKTTLLEGSVKISKQTTSADLSKTGVVLTPGQQAQVTLSEKPTVVNDADIAKVMAWKNGIFNFEDASLQEVMRQLARWYDIEVSYEKNIPAIQFGGKMSRNIKLDGLLKILKKTGVNFRIEEGRRLIVMPG